VGKSTLSVNLAAALSEGQAQKICVLDLNQRQGSIPLLLDLAPQHTLSDFLVDETHMEKEATSSYSENLMVIAASKDYETLDPTKLQKFVERLHGQYDYVLIDCENRLQGSTLTVLDQADMILYPITLDIPAVRNAFQDLEIFKKLYYTPEKLKIVINEIHPNKELLLPEIEKHLHWKIFATLPHGGSELVESLDMGKPLVVTKPQNSYSQAITQLMQSLNMTHARR
jgi:pilus assembly protein CpaE